MSELDSLLDATLDDLADLPSFQPFPAGAHKVLATMEAKTINNKSTIELTLKHIEAMEYAGIVAEADMAKPGDTANTLYFLDNDIGQGKFKNVARVFGEALGGSSLREIVEQVTDIECVVITSVSIDKNDPDKKYLNIKELQVT
jgi:hypothetical protein